MQLMPCNRRMLALEIIRAAFWSLSSDVVRCMPQGQWPRVQLVLTPALHLAHLHMFSRGASAAVVANAGVRFVAQPISIHGRIVIINIPCRLRHRRRAIYRQHVALPRQAQSFC